MSPLQHDRIKKLQADLARLESINDCLATQIQQIDDALRTVGFEEGLLSVQQAAVELMGEALDFGL